jgi:hypothetical protein
MRLVYREDHYLLHLSATAVNNRLMTNYIYIFPDFSGTQKTGELNIYTIGGLI